MMTNINPDAVRTEILKVRFAPADAAMYHKICNSLGIARATHAHKLVMDAVSAHVMPHTGRRQGPNNRSLERKSIFPGSRARMGGAMSPRLRV